jgi:hypothetical protein
MTQGVCEASGQGPVTTRSPTVQQRGEVRTRGGERGAGTVIIWAPIHRPILENWLSQARANRFTMSRGQITQPPSKETQV